MRRRVCRRRDAEGAATEGRSLAQSPASSAKLHVAVAKRIRKEIASVVVRCVALHTGDISILARRRAFRRGRRRCASDGCEAVDSLGKGALVSVIAVNHEDVRRYSVAV